MRKNFGCTRVGCAYITVSVDEMLFLKHRISGSYIKYMKNDNLTSLLKIWPAFIHIFLAKYLKPVFRNTETVVINS